MKKTQLRKIIRESIKELMTEQQLSTSYPKTYGCCLPGAMNYNSTISGNGCQNCGCIFAGPNADPNNFPQGYTMGNDIPENNNSCVGMDGYIDPAAYSGPTTSLTCDGSLWANQPMWETNFSNIVSNSNNPCNFLQNKMDMWMQNIGNAGSNQANQLACKIKYIQTVLWPQYNC